MGSLVVVCLQFKQILIQRRDRSSCFVSVYKYSDDLIVIVDTVINHLDRTRQNTTILIEMVFDNGCLMVAAWWHSD